MKLKSLIFLWNQLYKIKPQKFRNATMLDTGLDWTSVYWMTIHVIYGKQYELKFTFAYLANPF